MLQENIYRDWWGQQSAKKASNQQKKIYIPSYLPGQVKFKNHCFVSIAWTVSVSCVFAYSAVDVNKIVTAFLARPPPLINAQLT